MSREITGQGEGSLWYTGVMTVTKMAPYRMSLSGKFHYYGWTPADSGCWDWRGPVDTKGYGRVHSEGKTWKAHRIAVLLQQGFLTPGRIVAHTCDNPLCVNPDHLEEVSYAENSHQMVVRGRSLRNENHPGRKLTWDQVRYIRENPEGMSHRLLAEKFDVTRTNISDILKGNTWKEG